MANYYLKSGGGTAGTGSFRGEWVASTTYAVGDRLVPSRAYGTAAAKGYIYECTTAGAGSATQPTWVFTTPGTSTTTNGAAVFTCRDCITWANANVFLDYQVLRLAAGDTIYVSQAHAESTGSSLTCATPGTLASPCKIICANYSAAPPTTLATSGSVSTTGASSYTISGQVYVYGLSFNVGSGGSGVPSFSAGGTTATQVVLDNCVINITSTSAGASITLSGASNSPLGSAVTVLNSTFKFANAGQKVNTSVQVEIYNCTLDGSGSIPTILFSPGSTRASTVLIRDCDFSAMTTGKSLFDSANSSIGTFRLYGCSIGSGTAYSNGATTTTAAGLSIIENASSTTGTYSFYYEKYNGSVRDETTLVKTGGASDGTTPWSMKYTTNANANFGAFAFNIIPLPAVWNTALTSKTITVDILHDSVTALTNADIALEVVYYTGTATRTIGVSNANTIIGTPTAHASSSATWTTTGMTNPNKQKLEVTITAGLVGYIKAKVYVSKPSYTVYVDPVIQVL
jgi:hypothetical protein